MKISRITVAMILIFIAGIGSAFAQDESKKDKSKDKKAAAAKPVEVKANLMVLGADGKFADDVKLEDVKIYEDGVEQKITYFVKKQNAFDAGLVVDNTGSMRPQLETVIAAGATFVSNIRAQDEVFIVRFVNSEKIQLVQALTANKNRLNGALSNLYVEGGASAVVDALYFSAKQIADAAGDRSARRALILISDGEDRDSAYDQNQLFELLKTGDTQIFTIGLIGQFSDAKSKSTSKNFINRLALETGGAAFFVNSRKEELVAALKGILTELNSQYVVGYASTNNKRNGKSRKLTVQIADGANGAKRQPTLRESFVVPEEK